MFPFLKNVFISDEIFNLYLLDKIDVVDDAKKVAGLVKYFLVLPTTLPTVGKLGVNFVTDTGIFVVNFLCLSVVLLRPLNCGDDVTIC